MLRVVVGERVDRRRFEHQPEDGRNDKGDKDDEPVADLTRSHW
ncbi:MAG: hypothetical protein ACRD03_05015 [Acidimicrobiales bacterium]